MQTRLETKTRPDGLVHPRMDRAPGIFDESDDASTQPLLIPEEEPSRARPRSGIQDRVVYGTLALLWRHRAFVILTVLLTTSAGFVTTLMRTPYYVAQATIFPPPMDGSLSNLAFGGAAGLIGSLGLGGGGTTQFQLYGTFTYSRTVLTDLLQMRLDEAGFAGTLIDYLNIEDPDPNTKLQIGIDAVRARLTFASDKKTGVVSIGFQDVNPRVAALVVNHVVDAIDRFDVSTTTKRAGDKRNFIEQRLEESSRSLAAAEKRLEDFRATNLRIGNAPELLLEQARLDREVEIEQQVYLTLRKEYELARIEEERSVSVVNVLDRAVPPVTPAGPSVVKVTFAAALFGVLLSVGFFALVAVKPRQTLEEFLQSARLR
jgi:capsular polysaccharide biosynthesis protein